MRLSWLAVLVLVLGLFLGGCRCGDAPTDEPAASVAGTLVGEAPEPLTQQLASLGDRGMLVFVLHDEGWSECVAALAKPLGEPGLEVARSPLQLLRGLAAALEIPLAEGELRGRDQSRPIVFSVLEAPIDGPLGWVTASQPLEGVALGLRHQVLVPTTDAVATSESLAAWFDEGREPWPELVEGRAGARAWRSHDGFVALLSEPGNVRIVIVQMGSRTDRELARWQTQLDTPPVQPADTPALRQLGEAGNPLAVLIRPWRMRGVFTSVGLHEIREALASVSFDRRSVATALGLKIVLGGELMMQDEGAEFDDWTLTVSQRDGVARLRMVGSLTDAGRAALEAGKVGTLAPSKVAVDDVLFDAWRGVDPFALAPAGRGSAKLAGIPLTEAIELARNCGIGCPSHAILRMPLASVGLRFGGSETSSSGTAGVRVIAESSIDPESDLGAELGEFGKALGPISFRVSTTQAALALELVLGGREQLSFAPEFTGATWTSPMRAAPASAGDACLFDAGRHSFAALTQLYSAAPEQRASEAAASLAEAAPAFACASEHESSAAAGAALQRLMVEGIVAAHVDRLEIDPAIELLERECTRTHDASSCAHRDALRDGPKPRLPRTADAEILACTAKLHEQMDRRPDELPGLPLVISAAGVRVGSRTLPAEREAIAAAIVEQRGFDAERELGPPTLMLIVDEGLELAALGPVFEALGALGTRGFGMAFTDAEASGLRALSVGLRTPASFTVELPPRREIDDDEPPRESPEEGDAPAPPRKSGLYAMKGPQDAIPQLYIDLDDAGRTIEIRLEGKVAKVTHEGHAETMKLTELHTLVEDRGRGMKIELRASASTRWAELVTVITELCSLEVTLVVEP